jgi:rhodanese-related sulfurtransferase
MSHTEVDVNKFTTALGDNGQLVDVREPAEVAAGMLPGAVNIPMSKFVERMNELDPARPVVLVCRSGNRSGQVAEYLSGHGFAKVVNLTGGMMRYAG